MRKWLVGLCASLLCAFSIIGFTACETGNPDAPSHTHSFTNYVSNNDGTKTAVCDNGCGTTDTITDETYYTDGLRFGLNQTSDAYLVKGYRGKAEKIYIPTTYENLPVTSIGDSAFSGWSRLTEIIIPNSVTSIGASAFSGCSCLTEIVIPDSVTSIGASAFSSCSTLTKVAISNNVTSIGDEAFYNCDSLTEIVIPDSVTSIGLGVFSGCKGLTNIKVSENNTTYQSINGNLYSKDGKTLLQYAGGKTATFFTISDTVTNIGDGAFYGCARLMKVTIGNNVTSIGGGAFYGCSSLTEIVILDSVTSIGDSAFSACYSLTEIVILDSVTSIGKYAFASCDNLTIYCEAESQPSGWNSSWNFSSCPVVWGYKGE